LFAEVLKLIYTKIYIKKKYATHTIDLYMDRFSDRSRSVDSSACWLAIGSSISISSGNSDAPLLLDSDCRIFVFVVTCDFKSATDDLTSVSSVSIVRIAE